MRCRARINLGLLLGLALSAPALTRADVFPPSYSNTYSRTSDPTAATAAATATPTPAPTPAPPSAAVPPPAQPKHKGWSLFGGRCQCTECQRARVKTRDGVDVPAPAPVTELGMSPAPGVKPVPVEINASLGGTTSMRPWLVSPGERKQTKSVASRYVGRGRQPKPADGVCETCQEGGTAVAGADVMGSGPIVLSNNPPGRAVVGGETMVPGYAVVGGTVPVAEPAPIGAFQAQAGAGAGRMGPLAGAGPGMRRGPTDPGVQPSSFASDTIAGAPSGRPHILSHVFNLDMIGRKKAEEQERRKREAHAAISYGPMNQTVQDVPASAVYDKK